jgi:hypothetical protein
MVADAWLDDGCLDRSDVPSAGQEANRFLASKAQEHRQRTPALPSKLRQQFNSPPPPYPEETMGLSVTESAL